MKTPSCLLLVLLVAFGARVFAHPQFDPPGGGPAVEKANNNQIDPKQEESKDGDPVALQTGCFSMRKLDLSMPGRGADFAFIRNYRSGTTVISALGPGWDFNWNKHIELPLTHVTIGVYPGPGKGMPVHGGVLNSIGPPAQGAYYYDGETRIDLFPFVSAGNWNSAPGYFGKLKSYGDTIINHHNPDGSISVLYHSPTSFELRNAEGTVFTFGLKTDGAYFFGDDYYLTQVVDRHGNTFRLDYELIGSGAQQQPRLKYVYDTLWRKITLGYDVDGKLITVTDFDNREVLYSYDSHGYLSQARSPIDPVDFPAGKTTTYRYEPWVSDSVQRMLTEVVAPNEFASGQPYLVNLYDGAGRVTQQTLGGDKTIGTGVIAAGGVHAFRYWTQTVSHSWFVEKSRTLSVDPNGNVKLKVFGSDNAERVSIDFTGRVNPAGLSGLTVNDIVDVTFGSTPELTSARLKPESIPAASYAPPLRATDPLAFVTTRDLNADGCVTTERGPGYKIVNVYTDPQEDVFQRGNVIRSERWPVPNDGTPPQVRINVYEPVYNQVRASIDPRGNLSTFTPPNGGSTSPGRYMSLNVFDYQEGDLQDSANPIVVQAANWGIGLAQPHTFAQLASWWTWTTMPIQPITASANLGDVNGDGVHNNGNTIKSIAPTPWQYTDPTVGGSGFQPGSTVVKTSTYNDFSLITSFTDPMNGTTFFTYYSESLPSGIAGNETPTATFFYPAGSHTMSTVVGAGGGGLLKERISPSVDGQSVVATFGYTKLGHRLGEFDARGQLSTISYTALGQPSIITNPLGHQTKYTYDANDNIVQRSMSNRTQSFDAQYHPTGEVNGSPATIVTSFSYDLLDRCVERRAQLTSGLDQVTKFRYDKAGNRVLTLLPESAHDSANVTAAIFDERDLVWKASRGGVPSGFAALAAHGNIAEVVPTNANTSASTTDYDLLGNEVRVTDAENHVSQWQYDGFGRMRRADRALAGNYDEIVYDVANNVTHAYTYGDRGDGIQGLLSHLRSAYDELNREYQRDDQVFAIATTASVFEGALTPSDGYVTTRQVFDGNDRVTKVVDDNAHVSQWQYNANDLPTLFVDAVGNEERYFYNRALSLIRIDATDKSSDGTVSETYSRWRFFDKLNRLVAESDNIGRVTRWRYDSRNNVCYMSDAEGPMTSVLASLDNLGDHALIGGVPSIAINGHGNTTIYEYDLASRPTATSRHLRTGGTGSGAVDPAQSGEGIIRTTCEYDWNNNLTKQYDDTGKYTTYIYDALNRASEIVYSDGTHRFTQFDRCDVARSVTDPTGSTFVRVPDALHRLDHVNVTRGAGVVGTTYQEFKYDGMNRTVSSFDDNEPGTTSDDTAVTSRFDSLGHPLVRTQAIGTSSWTTQQTYDGSGAVRSTMYPSGRVIQRTLDPINRLNRVLDGGFEVARHAYIGGRLDTRFLAASQVKLYRTYDAARRVTNHVQRDGANAVTAGFDYGRSRAGRVLYESGQHVAGAGDVFTYDSSYRLVTEKRDVANPVLESSVPGSGGTIGFTGAFTLDGANNITSLSENGTSWTNSIGTANEYLTFKAKIQQRDYNGNRTRNGNRVYDYDAFNRLVRVRDLQGVSLATYRYTAEGLRVQQYDSLNNGLVYVHSDGNCIEERDRQTDTLVRQYVFGSGLDVPLQIRSVLTSGTVDSYVLTNVHESVVGLTNSIGQVIERVDYTAYGKPTYLAPDGTPLATQASVVGNPLLYSGASYDSDSGFYYLRNRFYDPVQGRFLTRDPSGLWTDPSASGNGYSFAGNDPVLRVDPWGLDSTGKHVRSTTDFLAGKGVNSRAAGIAGAANGRVDTDPNMQDPDHSAAHGMRPPGMTDQQAKDAAQDIINGHIEAAADALCGTDNIDGWVDSDRGAAEFGAASHTAQDETSPFHHNPGTGETVPWSGSKKDCIDHAGEVVITSAEAEERLNRANEQMWNRLTVQIAHALANSMGQEFRDLGYSAAQVEQAFQIAVSKMDAAARAEGKPDVATRLMNAGTDENGNRRSPSETRREVEKIKQEVRDEAKAILDQQQRENLLGDTGHHGSVSGIGRDPNENVKGDCRHWGSASGTSRSDDGGPVAV